MTTCAACMFEIDEGDTIVQAAECGHDCHEYCVPQIDDGLAVCYVCHPEQWVEDESANDTSAVETDADSETYQSTTDAVVDETANAVDAVAETPLPDSTATPTTDTTTGATDAPEVDLDAVQEATARSLRTAIDRAKAAASAAEATLAELTGAGPTRSAVSAAVDGDVAGWSAALTYCDSTPAAWDPYADGAADWPANQETIDDMKGGIAGLDSQSDILEKGQLVVDGMTAVALGEDVFETLSDTGERNVAEMAVGGPGWTGHNLHALSHDLKGWSSIRAEEGFVVIVRWAGETLQVGATGKHVQRGQSGDDYALDAAVATAFVPGLAWKRATGAHTLVEAGA